MMVSSQRAKDTDKLKQLKPPHDKYHISRDGSIFRYLASKQEFRKLKPFILGQYLVIDLCDGNGKSKREWIHKLVARYFIPNPLNYSVVNHLDGNKLNNNYLNLEWCTTKENAIHAVKSGLSPVGSRCASSKLTEDDVIKIRKRLNAGERIVDVAKDFPVTANMVGYIKNRKWWRHVSG